MIFDRVFLGFINPLKRRIHANMSLTGSSFAIYDTKFYIRRLIRLK